MALRHLGRGLVMRAKDALPTRGGGGGPIKYAPELRQTVRLAQFVLKLQTPSVLPPH